jgi:hypothetical protein
MSEKLLKIMLEELGVIRIVCVACNVAFEFPLEKLEQAFLHKYKDGQNWECPHCHAPVKGDAGPGTPNPFDSFRRALAGLREMKGIQVQFVLPDKD